MSQPYRLILASSSQYRRELLGRLGLPFESLSPDIDERARAGERPASLSERLAGDKARAGAAMVTPDNDQALLVIGSDQVASLDGVNGLGKPGSHDRAVQQLRQSSGQTVIFHTALCVYRVHDQREWIERVDTEVIFRTLSDEVIETYLRREQPYDCAGSAKSEGLGISLLHAINGPDPTALVGLPLIALTGLLQAAGLPVFADSQDNANS